MSGRTARIRLLLTTDSVGGVWQYSTDLARALGPVDVETVLTVLGPAPTPAQRTAAQNIAGVTLIETGLPLDWLAETAGEVEQAGRRIAELARHCGADLIQLNQPALGAETTFTVPVVAVSHSCVATWWEAVEGTDLLEDFAWRARRHGDGLRAANRVVTPSAAFAEATQRAYHLSQRPRVIHNGRAPLPCSPTAMHDFAFTAGRLWDRAKNVATLDRAAARLGVPIRAAGPLAGPNGETITLAHLHARGSMAENALAECLGARPVYVSAARYEPFGLAVLEAAAAGCPLVLSDIPTFRELWGEVATFVETEDDRGFATAIEALIGDTHLRVAQGEKARVVAGRFTPARMATDMVELYGELLAVSSSDRRAA